MKLLLDTHCWLWNLAEPERLGKSVRQLLEADQDEVLHRDPFDRLLVAQAVADSLVLVTADAALIPEVPGSAVQILRADR